MITFDTLTSLFYIHTKVKERNRIIFKRDNSVKNHKTMTKFELDLCIPMTYLYMLFQIYAYIPRKVRELKLKISHFFYVQEE
jgi:hypothetical protein